MKSYEERVKPENEGKTFEIDIFAVREMLIMRRKYEECRRIGALFKRKKRVKND